MVVRRSLRRFHKIKLFFVWLLLLALPCGAAAPPALMLWAWERPGDLRALSGSGVGVAFLAASVFFDQPGVRVVPRQQPVRLGPGTYRMAVVRVESPAAGSVVLNVKQRSAAAKAVAEVLRVTGADALQIDFDAKRSQREFYAGLLRDVRSRVGPGVFLSMTALVSWCEEGSWLESAAVDEVVPMLFEMGPGGGRQLRSPACQGSAGISLREAGGQRVPAKRTYVFAYENWTEALVRSVTARLGR